LKKHLTYSKVLTFIFVTLIPFFLNYGNKYLDLVKKANHLKEENKEKKAQIVSRNEIINRYYNDFGQLIEEKEKCEKTQKIIQDKIKNQDETIDLYDELFDSVSTELIKYERKVKEVPQIKPILLQKQPNKQTLQPVKVIILKETKETKKRFISKIKNKLDKVNILD